MPFDLVIDIENRPGALAEVATAISDAGVNIAAATCIERAVEADYHILVPHAEAARHALAISNLAVSREREVVVVEVDDQTACSPISPAESPGPASTSTWSTSPPATGSSSERPTWQV